MHWILVYFIEPLLIWRVVRRSYGDSILVVVEVKPLLWLYVTLTDRS